MKLLASLLCVVTSLVLGSCAASTTAPTPTAVTLESVQCGTIEKLHACGPIWLASQPSAADFALLRERGVRHVINLRKPDELKDFDQAAVIKELGLDAVNVPFSKPEELSDAALDQLRGLLRDAQEPTLLHCASSNRVGAVWLAYRTLDQGLAWDAALAEAKSVGLKTPAYETRIKAYVDARR
ncbi:MAG: protein tyrosine phosphatase family protein [Planctomycetes bacterium]|nr:protein tyrosine phosphatase family protein [Planctomycetota bacterium]